MQPKELEFDQTFNYSGRAYARELEGKTDLEIALTILGICKHPGAHAHMLRFIDKIEHGLDIVELWEMILEFLTLWEGDMATAVKKEIRARIMMRAPEYLFSIRWVGVGPWQYQCSLSIPADDRMSWVDRIWTSDGASPLEALFASIKLAGGI